jgi:hypothetical protein
MSRLSCLHRRFRALLMAGLITVACQRSPTTHIEPVAADVCTIGDRGSPLDTVFVSLEDRVVEPETVVPRSAAERLVFRQLYASLVALDCDGRIHPAVAQSWSSSDGHREWTFHLSEQVRFSDGVRLRALHVLDAWERVWPSVSSGLPRGEYFNFDRALSEDVVVVRLEEPDARLPTRLARPELAIARYGLAGERMWPIGTTAYAPSQTDATGGQLTLAATDPDFSTLVFVPASTRDVRDALDANLDVVVGRTRDFVSYAVQRDEYVSRELPWDRTYGLVLPRLSSEPVRYVSMPSLADVGQLRDGVARYVVSVDARAVKCENLARIQAISRAPDSGDRQVIVFTDGDQSAREIAERLVAMNNSVPGRRESRGRWSAEGVSRSRLLARVGSAAAAAVLSHATDSADACADSIPSQRDVATETLFLPLVQTRSHLVMRKGSVTAALHGDGVPQFFTRFGR